MGIKLHPKRKPKTWTNERIECKQNGRIDEKGDKKIIMSDIVRFLPTYIFKVLFVTGAFSRPRETKC